MGNGLALEQKNSPLDFDGSLAQLGVKEFSVFFRFLFHCADP